MEDCEVDGVRRLPVARGVEVEDRGTVGRCAKMDGGKEEECAGGAFCDFGVLLGRWCC